MVILGMSGQLGSGKDTLAKFLIDDFGYQRFAFADNLKDMCMNAFGLTHAEVHTELKDVPFPEPYTVTMSNIQRLVTFITTVNKFEVSQGALEKISSALLDKQFASPRQILQYVGTDILRDHVNLNYHVQVVENLIKHFASTGTTKFVITDARFPNERKWLKELMLGKVVLIERPSKVKTENAGHASETSLGTSDEYDITIINDGTLEDLRAMAHGIHNMFNGAK